MSRVTAIISAWLSASSSACHGLLIITAITPLTLAKPSATKCQRTEAGERGNYRYRCVSVMLPRSIKYTKELLMLKLKMMLCVMMLPLVVVGCTSAVCQSVREAITASGVDNAASPRLPVHTINGIISPSERG